ncbi:MAG: hypothetical protein ACLPXT_08155 [Terracidiphilus sp.]
MKKLVFGLMLVFCLAAPIASQAQVVIAVGHDHHHHHHHDHHHPRFVQ